MTKICFEKRAFWEDFRAGGIFFYCKNLHYSRVIKSEVHGVPAKSLSTPNLLDIASTLLLKSGPSLFAFYSFQIIFTESVAWGYFGSSLERTAWLRPSSESFKSQRFIWYFNLLIRGLFFVAHYGWRQHQTIARSLLRNSSQSSNKYTGVTATMTLCVVHLGTHSVTNSWPVAGINRSKVTTSCQQQLDPMGEFSKGGNIPLESVESSFQLSAFQVVDPCCSPGPY